ncbi:hypothetical protein N9Z53_03375 [Mariniblastus sp.]|nr:hypothetical protein [Mariniblastus sp.]
MVFFRTRDVNVIPTHTPDRWIGIITAQCLHLLRFLKTSNKEHWKNNLAKENDQTSDQQGLWATSTKHNDTDIVFHSSAVLECLQMCTLFLDNSNKNENDMVGIKNFEQNSACQKRIANNSRHTELLK